MCLSPLYNLLLFATLVASCTGSTSEDTNAKNKSVVAHDLRAETSSAEERNGAQAILTMLETLPDDAMKAKRKAVLNTKTIISRDDALDIKGIFWNALNKRVYFPNNREFEEFPENAKKYIETVFRDVITADLEMIERLQKWTQWIYSQIRNRKRASYGKKFQKLDPLLKRVQEAEIDDYLVHLVLPTLWRDFIKEKKLSGLDNVPTLYHLNPELQEEYKRAFFIYVYEDADRAIQFEKLIQWLRLDPKRKEALAQKLADFEDPPVKRARKTGAFVE
ncbi:hypothetical protein PsorP6_015887 [Peronosclerospora sorghi]|uniref:Uncharacterized protein n=1 Tax=Peronosclerospora sorghi TaxID=230839 RepID=A0ACC0WP89_9STRA|nr:hypothetical protein PsorP6_015887 [Peronosclerospora sorghi]